MISIIQSMGQRDKVLRKLYKVFRKEFDNADKEELLSLYKTHVSAVIAGFPKYVYDRVHGNPNNWPSIADFGDEIRNVKCAVIKTFSESIKLDFYHNGFSARTGKAFALLLSPGPFNNYEIPVPIHISKIDEQVIKDIITNDANESCEILKDFLNCHDVFVLGSNDATLELHDNRIKVLERKAWSIKVLTRDIDSFTGKNICSIINYNVETGDISISNKKSLRAKIPDGRSSLASLRNLHIYHIPVTDLRLHNSWITVNRLQVDTDGSVKEIEEHYLNTRKKYTSDDESWRDSVIVRDSITDEAYRIWFESVRPIPIIYRIDYRNGDKEFVELHCTNEIKLHLLPIMAHAVIIRNQMLYRRKKLFCSKDDDQPLFSYNGIVYEYTLSGVYLDVVEYKDGYRGEDDRGQIIWDYEGYYANNNILPSGICIKEIQPTYDYGYSKENRQDIAINELSYFEQLRTIARHFNGSNQSWIKITKKWFDKSLYNDPFAIDNLQQIILSIKSGNTDVAISHNVATRVKKYLKIDYNREYKSAYKLLLFSLREHGIKIVLDIEEGQRTLDEQQGKNRHYFVSHNGTIIYGFVDRDTCTIYLDPELLNVNTIVHEFTHLWTYVLRQKEAQEWAQLVHDLKNDKKTTWERVAKTYRKYFRDNDIRIIVNDDYIADEVFAHYVGDYCESYLNRSSGRDEYFIFDDLFNTVSKNHESFKKEMIEPNDRINYLREIVILDLQCGVPMTNYSKLEDRVEANIKANELITVDLSHLDEDTFESIVAELYSYYHQEIIEDLDEDNHTITVRSKNMNLLNRWLADDDEDDQDISFHIDLDEDEAYLPEIFKSTPKEDSNEIDFSEYDQFTIELYDKLRSLEPYAHYIDGSYLIFLGKEGQTLSIECYNDAGETTSFSIGDPIRSTDDGKSFYVASCDSEERAVDDHSKVIG